ncbi:MAG: MGDG synthase family glycosyltransferase [Bacillota bacterium]
MNILIFSVSIGNGHDQVAHTLRNEIIHANNKARVKIINTINFISPLLDKVILDSYMNILKFYPKAWGMLYEKTNKLDPVIDVNEIANRLMTSRLQKSIINFNPDAIICTHSFPSAIISRLKQKKLPNYPLLTVITDYNIHSSYINDGTDKYVIAHENLIHAMESYGVNSSRVLPFGIPIKHEFSMPLDRKDIIKKQHLEDKRTILVMGGGLGLGDINNIVKELDSRLDNIQIIAVAGRNHRLELKLKSMVTRNKFVVYGFVSNIHELMEISDCMISKPGGVTTAEILCKQKPLIIFSPLPGQEYENTEYLMNSGVAVSTSETKKIPMLINHILNDEIRIKCMKELIGGLRKPYAASDVVRYIIDNYSSNKNMSTY